MYGLNQFWVSLEAFGSYEVTQVLHLPTDEVALAGFHLQTMQLPGSAALLFEGEKCGLQRD